MPVGVRKKYPHRYQRMLHKRSLTKLLLMMSFRCRKRTLRFMRYGQSMEMVMEILTIMMMLYTFDTMTLFLIVKM